MRPSVSNLVGLSRQRAQERPDVPAFAFLTGGDLHAQVLTYGQLDFQARTIAAFLQGLGLQGERALLLYPPGVEFIAGLFACLYAGVIAVPAYPPRMNRNAFRIVSIAQDSRARLALTTAAMSSRLKSVAKHTPELAAMQWVATDVLDSSLTADWRDFSPAENNLAYLQYTSGSTAAPRGVMITHANVLHNSASIAAGFEHTPDSVSLCWLPHFHDMGLIDGIIQPLYSGFTGHLMSPAAFLQEPARWLKAISQYRVTHSGGPNFAYELCSAKLTAQQREQLDLSSWKIAYNGAEPVHARTLELFAEKFEPCGFRRSAFYPAYGLAEATLKVSGGKKGGGPACCTVKTNELERNRIEITHAADPEGRTLVGAGAADADVKLAIVDSESHRECSTGEVGEVWVSSPSVAAGYWNRPEESREVFGAYLQSGGQGPFLRTGDLGFVHNGEIFVTGRLKDLIIIRGRNHYPQDIERTVQQSHSVLRGMSGAAFSVAVGTDEGVAIVQEVDPRRSNLLDKVVEDVRRAIADEHEIQPHAILLVNSGSAPRTSSGKVQRQLCRQTFLSNSFQPLAEWRRPSSETAQTYDAVPEELTAESLQFWLRARFAAKLAADISEIHVHQPVHQLGLDSLMALEISHSIEIAFGISLSQSSLLQSGTVADLADCILSQSGPPLRNTRREFTPSGESPTQYSLSQGQQAVWFLQQLAPENRAYHIAHALRLKSEIDVAALQRAFQKLLDRHGSLRAVFSLVDGKPAQSIREQAAISFQSEDASPWNATELSQRLQKAANEPFDLSCGPLFRVLLLSRSACDHVLILAVHHIVSDLWSLGLLLSELSEFYAAEVSHVPAELPSLSTDYAGFVKWQEELLQPEEAEHHWRYWQKQLEGDLPSLELPTDFPRPLVQTYKGAVKIAKLESELVQKLKSTAAAHRVTLHAVLTVLFEIFLHRYSGQEDVLTGTPTSGRSRPEFDGIVGYFVNPVVIRLNFSGSPDFEQAMVCGRRVVLEALEHQVFPFATLVQRLQPQRDSSRSPLFQAMFIWQKTGPALGDDLGPLALGIPGTEVRLGDLALESVAMDQCMAQFDLTLAMAETGGEIVASFEYNTDLFESATVARMMRHFERLVQGCIANPTKPISEVLLLSDEEHRQAVSEWNKTERDYPAVETVLELLEAQAQRTPDHPAVIFGGKSLSYRELHRQANQWAHFLQKLGVGPEVTVGVCMERSAELVTVLLGIMKAGGAYVPLDPGYPAERLHYMLHDAHPAVVLVDQTGREKLQGGEARVVCVDEERGAIGAESEEAVGRQVGGKNLAYVIYTSGSTGQPKGVMNVHGGLLNRLQWMQEAYGLQEKERVLQKTPFGFDVSVWEFFWPLLVGGTVVVARPDGHKDSRYLVRVIQEEGITTVHFVPSMLGIFLQEKGVEGCGSLRRVMASGEALTAPLVENFHEHLQWAELHNLYGPTEASIDVSYWVCAKKREARTSIPIGRPIANTQLYILDSHLQSVPVGLAGELYIGGVGLARGYWRKADLTAEKFIPDPFSGREGDRLYRTGDLARRRKDGQIEYLGRNDLQIKIRGFRIELSEIEVYLARHPAVRESVVVVREDTPGEKPLIAYYTAYLDPGAEQLRTHLSAFLPEYMVPSAYVRLESLPITSNGKLNRKALPAPDSSAYITRIYEPPAGEAERTIAAIWTEVLGAERVGRHDNFFSLGGHSLLAMTLVDRMQRNGLVVEAQAIFTTRSLAELAAIAGKETRLAEAPPNLIPPDCDAITPEMLPLITLQSADIRRIVNRIPGGAANVQDIYPLTPLQEGIFFQYQMSGEGDAYLVFALFSFDCRDRLDRYLAAMQAVIQRHDILRTCVLWEGLPEPVQVVQRKVVLPVEEVELDSEKGDASAQLRARFDPQKFKIDIQKAPLLRIYVTYDRAHKRWLMAKLAHHLVDDNTSLRTMFEEIRMHLMGQADQLPVPLSYRNLVAHARLRNRREEHEAFFRQMLGNVSEPTEPFGILEAHGDGSDIEEARLKLSASLAQRVRKSARNLNVNPASLFHLAWALVLARTSGRKDVVFGTVLFGRLHSSGGLERMLGLFVNTLPLRIQIGENTVEAGIRHLYGLLSDLLRHEHASLNLAQRCSAIPAPTPLFAALMNYRHSRIKSFWDESAPAFENIRLLYYQERTNYPFALSVDDWEDDFQLTAQAPCSVGPARLCELMSTALASLVKALETTPQRALCTLEVLSSAEREQLIVHWNNTAIDFSQGSVTVVQMVEQQAAMRPMAVAVRDRKRELTYQELNEQTNQWAHRLRKMGVQAEAKVAICLERSADMIAAQLGVMKAGGAYIPLDHEHPAERLQYQISDSGASVLITNRVIREKLHGTEQARLLCIEEEQEVLEGESRENPEWKLEKEELAYLIYTSGSTGRPKGVQIEHRGLLNLVLWHQQAYGIEAGERGSQVAGTGFDASVWETWPYLAAGASLEIAADEDRGSAERLREWLVAKGITVSFVPTPLAEAVMRLGEWNSKELRLILTGGDRLQERPPEGWTVEVVNHYGPTECTVVATVGAVEKHGLGFPAIGKPVSNTRAYVLDEDMQPVPVGVAGELYIGGAGLARGYAGKADLTAEQFVPDGLSGKQGQRLYRTGDQCRWNQRGELEFIGRKDQQVKIRGHRIEVGEIEAALQEHQGIREAVVAVQEREAGERALIAYVVTDQEKKPGGPELRPYLQGKLPSYMVPSAFVQLEAIPLTPSGKVNRQALKKWEFSSVSDQQDPRTATEARLAEIWKELLRLERVGIHDGFFELGGDSIISLQVVARAHQQGIRITPRQLFESPTIAALAAVAERVEPDREETTRNTITGETAVTYPLSPLQKGILFEYVSAPESGVYVQQLMCTIRGGLQIEAFRNAWRQVVARHSILRTLFIWERDDEPLQMVRQEVSVPFEFHDWSRTPQGDQEQQWRALLVADRARGFTLSEAPLLRLTLLQVGSDAFRLLFTFHHVILDGWSLPLLFREVFARYGEPTPREAYRQPAVPYSNYIRWLQEQEVSAAETYWRLTLRGFDAPASITLSSRGRPNEHDQGFSELQIQLSPEETARLRSAAKQQGLTLSILVQAAWAILLSRYSGEEDIVFGLTVSGRSANLAGIEEMIGLFINTLPIRSRVMPEQTLLLWLKELHMCQVDLSQYEHTPLPQVQKWSDIPAGRRLFDSILVFENFPLDESLLQENHGLIVEDVEAIETTNYPLTVTAVPQSDLRLLISYDRRHFDHASVTRMLGHLQSILVSMAEAPHQLIRDVRWITPGERDQLLLEWSRTATRILPEECFHQIFEEQANRNPKRIAIAFGAQRMTYGELNQRANQLARHLKRNGVGPEVRVGIYLERGMEIVVAVLAVAKAGGAYVPLDSNYPGERIQFMFRDAQAAVLITQSRLREQLALLPGRTVVIDEDWEEIAGESDKNLDVAVAGNNLAYVIYTSGSTGKPRGVSIEHRSLMSTYRGWEAAYQLGSRTAVHLQMTSFSFDVFAGDLVRSLCSGKRLVICPTEYLAMPDLLFRYMAEHQVDTAEFVPVVARNLIAYLRKQDLSLTMDLVIMGSDLVTIDDLSGLRLCCSDSTLIVNTYGLTECTIDSSCYPYQSGSKCLPEAASGVGASIGRPLTNTCVYVLDPQMQPVPVGFAGEVYIGGPGVARGYWLRPELTAEKFLPDPFSGKAGERLYRTGDFVRWRPDGDLEFAGRADRQVKIRGLRIEPGEIESALRTHAEVRDAVVMAHEQQLVAYVAGVQCDQNSLRQYLKQSLPDHMVPAHFVFLDVIPTLPNGKVDRRALPAPQQTPSLRTYVAPRNAREEVLAEIWSAVLKTEHVGIEDNFFELGGDSIISLQVVARARQQGIRITPRHLFESPTIAALAAVAAPMADPSEEGSQKGIVQGEVTLTPIQRWFFEQELEETAHYNQALILEAWEELNEQWLKEVWKKLVEHHDALRLRYQRVAGQWRQEYAAREESEFFSVVELKGNEEEHERELDRLLDEMQTSLDLERGSLLRVAYVKPERVAVVIHHLAVDGVSWRILVEDLETAYAQIKRGEKIRLPGKTSSFQKWAQHLEREVEEGRYAGEAKYWLGGEENWEKVPQDWAGGENREGNRECIRVELDEEQTREMLQEVPATYHTQINDVLMTALMGAWEKWTGKQRLLIDLEGHGRGEEFDVSRTVGWFTAVYPLRLEVGRNEGTAERLKGIKEQIRKAPRHGLGYGALRYLSKNEAMRERWRKHTQAEISFNYLGQVDAGISGRGVFRSVRPILANNRGKNNRCSHLVEVEARVERGRLLVEWNYSREVHRRQTIEALGLSFVEKLRAIISHCLAPGAGGFTPSDFPLAGLDQHALDLLVKDPASISDIYPLSPVQQGLLFHTLYDGPGSGTYVEQLSCTLEGDINVAAFEQAWQEVIHSHPVLRSGFSWEGLPEPLQVVHRSARALFIHHDSRQLAGDRRLNFEDVRRADAELGFDLAAPPLMRFILAQFPGRFEFLWSSHHLLLDGWSMSLVLQEVLERYLAIGEERPFHEVWRRPYRDYIAWVRRQELSRAKEYWQRQLNGFAAATALPGERAVVVAKVKQYSEHQLTLSADITTHLQTVARQHQVTLSALIQTAWALLLKHYTGQLDLVFGVTVSGRPPELAGVDEMVGVFINTLPLCVTLASGMTALSVLRELQAAQLQLNEFAYTPLSRIQEWSRIPAGQPLFETLLVFENYPVDSSLRRPQRGLKFSQARAWATSNYPLTLIIRPGPEMTLHLSYDVRRFESDMISQLLTHLQNLIVGITAHPIQQAMDVQLLGHLERRQLLAMGNQTGTEYPRDQSIQQLFEEQVRHAPQNVAVVFEGQRLSYAELNRRANQLAHYLRKQGVDLEVRVGLCMERSLDMIVALLGILKAGGVYVSLDVGSPPERLEMMLAESRSKVVLTQPSLRRLLPENAGLQVVCVDSEQDKFAGENSENPEAQASGENLAYVSYTSGSTGRPKGVSVPHRAVVRLVKSNDYARLDADQVILQFAPLAFDASTLEIWGSLLNGGSLVVMPSGPRSTEEIGRVLAENGITTAWLTAGLFHLMVDQEIKSLKHVNQLLAGGDVLSVAHVNRYLAEIGKNAVLINGYGPTENTTFTCCHQMKLGGAIEGPVPIGRPIRNTQVYVLNQEMEPAPFGVVGELYIGGEGLARGYENDAELTAERFVPHPYRGVGERLYRSGDEVRWRRDGVLEFVGRADRQLKIRGYRVEPGEIESVMMQHEAVREAIVAFQGGQTGETPLIAYVVPRSEAGCSFPDLQSFLKIRLPDYMRPGAILLLDKLPLTPNGKVDYKALPAPEASERLRGVILPRTPVEHALAEIWQQVLGVRQISVDDDFFQLGGHSLLALQIASRVRTVLGVDLPLRTIFEEPTIGDQARAVERLLGSGKTSPPLEIHDLHRPDVLPLSFAQQRLWFLHQLEPTSDFYNVPVAIRVYGPLDADVLRKCCNEMVYRHEILRTSFPIRNGEPVQQIDQAVARPLEVTDLSQLPPERAEAEAREIIAREAQRPFDLSRGPLFRVSLLRLGKEQQILLFNMHHVVVDGWSFAIFTRELAVLYEAFLAGHSSPLPPLSLQYADYALWQREWLSGEPLESQLMYWRQQLSGVSPLQLQTDYPRPKVQTFRGARKSTQLSREFAESLTELVRREHSTLFMVLLTTLKVLLYRYTGQAEITVGTPVAGRTRQEIEDLIGFFVNTLALRTRIFGNPGFTEFLRQVREVSLGAYAHQDLPFEKLVEELHPDRDDGRLPIFQVMFAFEDVPPRELLLAGLRTLPFEIESRTAQFDLTLTVGETPAGLRISFEYNTDLFHEATIERMMQHFRRLLQGIAVNSRQSITEIPLLNEEERRQVVAEWNQTERSYPAFATVLDLLEAQARKTPNHPAVIFEKECFSYCQLHQQANQLAHFLQKLGVGPEIPVGVCMQRSMQMVIALLGIMKAGGAYVPLDPSYPDERLNFMLQDSRLAVVIVEKNAREKLKSAGARLVCLEEEWAAMSAESREAGENRVSAQNLAYVIYTSGSTGQPKGVMNIHGGLLNRLQWMQEAYGLDESDRVLQKTPFGFDVSVWEFFWPLMYGACLVMARPEGHKDSQYLVRAIQQEGITTVHFVPSMLAVFLLEKGVEKCSSLRRVIASGEALSAPLVESFHERLRRAELHNLYGPTEASIDVSSRACRREHEETTKKATIPIGQPIANTQIYILDSHLQPVPVGMAGELHIGGVALSRGYWRRAELTAEKFISDPFSGREGERLYRTGDLALWRADGNIEYLGRLDNQVKLRGFRIELGEIEAVLQQHAEVTQAAVVLREDESGNRRLIGYIVSQNGTDGLLSDSVRDYLRTKLPEYMIPEIVQVNEIPLTVHGKIDYNALPAISSGSFSALSACIAPRNAIEEQLEKTCCSLLHVERMGVHDNFFDLGGHSLLAMRLMTWTRETFQVEAIPLREFFETPTIAGLAALSVRYEARSGQTEKIASFLQQLDAMSAEQVMTLRSKDMEQQAAQSAVSKP
ncbi:MAG TPA: non-ribosomal peptide synthase/polyketide synthase [Candidatus Angelobacter sp.]